MIKEARQSKILSLIGSRRIATQEELSEMLERAGVGATQSSISRDLEELGIVKANGYYTLPKPANGAASSGLLSLDTAGEVLVVAKCEPGMASALTVQIDRAGFEEVIGTIAGEDTIFIAVNDRKSQRAVIKKIWELFDIGSR